MRVVVKLLVTLSMLLTSLARAGDLVVIANPASGIDHLSRNEAIDLYMGRNRKLPSGATAMPIDLETGGKEREQFYAKLVNKDLPEINSYWARLVFSGKATPPFQVSDTNTAIELVAANPSAIAYIDRSAVTHRVKVVLELKQ